MPTKDQKKDYAALASQHGGVTVPADSSDDLTSNSQNEGLYRMGSYDFDQGNVTKPEIQVPFSRIDAATKAGYKLHPDEVDRYHKDSTHKGQGPTLWERTKDFVTKNLEPVENPEAAYKAAQKGGKKEAPKSTLGEAEEQWDKHAGKPVLLGNIDRSFLRTIVGIPGYGKDLYDAWRRSLDTHNANEVLDLLDPGEMVGNLKKQWDADYAKDPQLAKQNLIGSVGGLVAAGRITHSAEKIISKLPLTVDDSALHPTGPKTVEGEFKVAPERGIKTVAGRPVKPVDVAANITKVERPLKVSEIDTMVEQAKALKPTARPLPVIPQPFQLPAPQTAPQTLGTPSGEVLPPAASPIANSATTPVSLADEGKQATIDAFRKQFPNTKLTDEEISQDAPRNQDQKTMMLHGLYMVNPQLADEYVRAHPEAQKVFDRLREKFASNGGSDAQAGRNSGIAERGTNDATGSAGVPAAIDRSSGAGRTDGGNQPVPQPGIPQANSQAQLAPPAPLVNASRTGDNRVYYRGTNPENPERITTGDSYWDSLLFAADDPKHALNYGRSIERINLKPDAKVLREGTREFKKVVGPARKGENLLQFSSRAAKAAQNAGYDAIHFQLQGTVGTAILNRDAIESRGPHQATPSDSGTGIEMARTAEGKVKLGADVAALGKTLGASLYQGNASQVITKELLQNAMDSVRDVSGDKNVTIELFKGNYPPKTTAKAVMANEKNWWGGDVFHIQMPDGTFVMDPYLRTIPKKYEKYDAEQEIQRMFPTGDDGSRVIKITDSGIGMSKEELETVFTDLGASGKRDMETASGGFGLAKAAPMMMSKKLEVSTVKNEGGKLMRHSFTATPDEFLGEGVDIHSEELPADSGIQTGTTIISHLPENAELYGARSFINQAKLSLRPPGTMKAFYNGEDILGDGAHAMASDPIASEEVPGAKLDLYTSHEKSKDPLSKYTSVSTEIHNNGIYQFSQRANLPDSDGLRGLPTRIAVDVKATVPEGHPDYPFTANREELRGSGFTDAIDKMVKKYITDAAVNAHRKQLADMYWKFPLMDGYIPMFDSGTRFTPEEFKEISENPALKEIASSIQLLAGEAIQMLQEAGKNNWRMEEYGRRAKRIGLVFSQDVHGVHITNPANKGEATIFINPFDDPERGPDELASLIWHTIKHELVHDKVSGHNESFSTGEKDVARALGRMEIRALTELRDRYADPNDLERVRADFDRAFQIYQTSRGRDETTPDIFRGEESSAGVDQPGGKAIDFGGLQLGGEGTVPGESGSSGTEITKTPEFKAWFKESKVVDENNAPLRVYHAGTFDENEDPVPSIGDEGFHFGTKDAAAMRQTGKLIDDLVRSVKYDKYENDDGVMVWGWSADRDDSYDIEPDGFKTKAAAERHFNDVGTAIVDQTYDGDDMPVTEAYLSIQNPKRVKDQGDSWAAAIKKGKEQGYDGIVYRNEFEDKGKDSYIAFSPTQIKSVKNKGGFDPNNPDITANLKYKAPAGTPEKIAEATRERDELGNYIARQATIPPRNTPERDAWDKIMTPLLRLYEDAEHRIEAHEKGIGEIHDLANGARVLFLHPAGLDALHVGIGGNTNPETQLNGLAITRGQVVDILGNLNILRPPMWEQVVDMLWRAMDRKNGTVTVATTRTEGMSRREWLGVLYEELFHTSEKMLPLKPEQHLELNAAIPPAMIDHLEARYPHMKDDGTDDRAERRVREAVAHLAAASPAEYGISDIEFGAFWFQYLAALEKTHGPEALDKLQGLAVDARQGKRRFQNARGYGQQAPDAGGPDDGGAGNGGGNRGLQERGEGGATGIGPEAERGAQQASGGDVQPDSGKAQAGVEPQASLKINVPNSDKIKAFHSELMERTTGNPFNNRESVWDGRASFELYPFEGRMHISSIRSFEPSTGAGAGALKFITDLADKHGITLDASPKPFGHKNLSAAKLKAWYIRNGFRPEKGGDLVREPQSPVQDKNTPTAKTDTPQFKEWFSNSKVVDESGKPLQVYRGDFKAGRLGKAFKIKETTSGRFYFTDDPEIASKYATEKPDSQNIEDHSEYHTWYKFPSKKYARETKAPNMDHVWYRLTPEEQERVKQVALTTTMDDQNNIVFDAKEAINGKGGMEWEAKQKGGNWLRALSEAWLTAGTLYGQEQRFGEILKHIGLDYDYHDPYEANSIVTPVYLRIRNPLDTENIPQTVIDRLKKLANMDRSRTKPGFDQWDKNTITFRDWVGELERDQREHTTFAWTRVPDKVTLALQSMGYDGVKDTGGKHGGKGHTVWIAFEPNQIKSSIGNKGTYSLQKNDITANLSEKDGTPSERLKRIMEEAKARDPRRPGFLFKEMESDPHKEWFDPNYIRPDENDERPLDERLDEAEGDQNAIDRILAKEQADRSLEYPAGALYTVEGRDGRPTVIDVSKDASVTVYDDPHDFVNSANLDDYYPDYEEQFNKDFWEYPADLYHATDSSNVPSIMKEGLHGLNKTRGLSNRGVGASVFAVTDPEWGSADSYGDAWLRIDTEAMKEAGVMPYLSKEPDVQEGELRESLAHAIGLHDYSYDYESGMDPETIIVNDGIDPRFIHVENASDEVMEKFPTIKPVDADANLTYKAADDDQPFYLKSERAIAKMGKNPMPKQSAMNFLIKNGVSKEEMYWTGLDELLNGPGTITAEEIKKHQEENDIQVEEVQHGGTAPMPSNWKIVHDEDFNFYRVLDQYDNFIEDREGLPVMGYTEQSARKAAEQNAATPTRWDRSNLVTPGGENQRELLLRMPHGQRPTPIKYPEPLTELPIGFDISRDSLRQGDQYAIIPPGQNHGRPWGGRYYPTVEAAKTAALELINQQLKEHAEAHWRAENDQLYKFQTSHWDEPNVLAHVRFNDRNIPGVGKTAFIEEIQSDWHQQGSNEGYIDTWEIKFQENGLPEGYTIEERESHHPAYGKWVIRKNGTYLFDGNDKEAIIEQAKKYALKYGYDNSSDRVPNAPFKGSAAWSELMVKRMVRWAVKNGYDAIAVTPGQIQDERNDLSKTISKVRIYKETPGVGNASGHDEGGKYQLTAMGVDGHVVYSEWLDSEEEIHKVIGKDLTRKVLETTPNRFGVHDLTGMDLKIGGKFHYQLYDEIIPNVLNKIGKKFGVKVETAKMPVNPGARDVSIRDEGDGEWWSVVDNDINAQEGPLAEFGTRQEAEAYVKTLGYQEPVHVMKITPEMRESVGNEPFSLFNLKQKDSSPSAVEDKYNQIVNRNSPDDSPVRMGTEASTPLKSAGNGQSISDLMHEARMRDPKNKFRYIDGSGKLHLFPDQESFSNFKQEAGVSDGGANSD